MALILNIETSMQVCSIALAQDGCVIAERTNTEANRSMELINPFIEEIFQSSGKSFKELDAVAISGGPGSYTGLRVGASCAKGLCYALEIPLIHVSGLDGMIQGVRQRYVKTAKCIVPLIDARREEVFAKAVSMQDTILEAAHYTVNEEFVRKFVALDDVLFFGTGSTKTMLLEKFPNQIFAGFIPNASDIAILSEQKFGEQQYEDLAYYEPQYLKEVYFTKNN